MKPTAGSSRRSDPTTSCMFRSDNRGTMCCMITPTARSAASISTAVAPKWWRGVRKAPGSTGIQTKQLYFTDNGRDWMSEDLPKDKLNRVTKVGQHFGEPYCHPRQYPRSRIRLGQMLRANTCRRSRLLGPHPPPRHALLYRHHVPEGLQKHDHRRPSRFVEPDHKSRRRCRCRSS